MARKILIVTALLGLSACGDPLSGVERMSETELALEPQSAAALPTEAETAPETGILDRLLPAPETPTFDGQGGGPIPPEPVTEAVATQEPAPEPARRGIFARLLGSPAPQPEPVAAEQAAAPAAPAVPEAPAATTAAAEPAPEPAPQPDAAPPVRRSGFLGLFGGGARSAEQAPRTASLTPDMGRGRDSVPAPRAAPVRTVDTLDVAPGTALPFGQIARVCDATRSDLGRRIETSGPRGKVFTLYDSDPRLRGPRPWYVTGFADGCPRQFTAALALFGAPSLYEDLRFVLPPSAFPYAETDRSYDRIKSRICGVSRSRPCGSRIDAVERSTVFISAYERPDDNARWSDILLHDGAVMAAAIKAP
ncbi:MAG: hypothetical protein AAGM84_06145 [Pseudomonadota bacterium]